MKGEEVVSIHPVAAMSEEDEAEFDDHAEASDESVSESPQGKALMKVPLKARAMLMTAKRQKS